MILDALGLRETLLDARLSPRDAMTIGMWMSAAVEPALDAPDPLILSGTGAGVFALLLGHALIRIGVDADPDPESTSRVLILSGPTVKAADLRRAAGTQAVLVHADDGRVEIVGTEEGETWRAWAVKVDPDLGLVESWVLHAEVTFS